MVICLYVDLCTSQSQDKITTPVSVIITCIQQLNRTEQIFITFKLLQFLVKLHTIYTYLQW